MNTRKALVTGAGTGIGQGIAIELAKAGYDVAVHYFGSKIGAQETVLKSREYGVKSQSFHADLSHVKEIDRLFEEAVDFLGGLDLYVNNSGITLGAPFIDVTEDLFDLLVATDMKSAYFCVQSAAKVMIERSIKGNVVVITSNNAMMQRYKFSVYGIIKAALVKMVRHAAVEFARYGIRVNAIAPGWTITPRILKEVNYEEICADIPMRRMATVQEIGQMVLFHDSDIAASITGNCLVVDGGFTLINDNPQVYGF